MNRRVTDLKLVSCQRVAESFKHVDRLPVIRVVTIARRYAQGAHVVRADLRGIVADFQVATIVADVNRMLYDSPRRAAECRDLRRLFANLGRDRYADTMPAESIAL